MTYKVTEVFVPGGLPKHTYVARTGRKLEDRISASKNNLCKIMTVTGPTKTVEYEPLRASIRSILNDGLPQANEVSRVLEQMAKISSTDESSVPVIDYEKDERKLHITDPFFAFFLRWGHGLIDV